MKEVMVHELVDYGGTLQQLYDIVAGLINQYGADAVITFDAGANNVAAYLKVKDAN